MSEVAPGLDTMAVMLEPLVQNLQFVYYTDIMRMQFPVSLLGGAGAGRPSGCGRLQGRVLPGGCLLFIVTMLSFWVRALVETVEARHCVARAGGSYV